jgi:hypothetical protein
VPGQWSIQLTGDFNGDSLNDILWRDTWGNVAIWENRDGGLWPFASFSALQQIVRSRRTSGLPVDTANPPILTLNLTAC